MLRKEWVWSVWFRMTLLGSHLVLFIAVKKPVLVVPWKNTAIVKPSFPATSRVVLLSSATYATNPSQLQEIPSLSNLFLFWPSLPLLLDWLGIGLPCLASNHLTDLRTNTLTWMSLNSKFLLVGGRLTQLVSSFFYILTCILLLNTPEINYLHYLIEVNHQTSHFGQVYGVHIDGRKILGTEKFEVPLYNSWLIHFVIHEIEKKIRFWKSIYWAFQWH